jgi:hypothetical protein
VPAIRAVHDDRRDPSRRLGLPAVPAAAGPCGLGRAVLVLAAVVLLVAYGVAIWAMAAKLG